MIYLDHTWHTHSLYWYDNGNGLLKKWNGTECSEGLLLQNVICGQYMPVHTHAQHTDFYEIQ